MEKLHDNGDCITFPIFMGVRERRWPKKNKSFPKSRVSPDFPKKMNFKIFSKI